MGWFTDLKIGVKLMISYFILCVFMLTVGIMGIMGLRSMSENANNLYYDSLLGVSNIKDTLVNIEAVRLITQRCILPEYRNQLSTLESDMKKNADSTNAYLKGYEDAMSNPDDRVMFQELQKLLVDTREKRSVVINLAKSGDYAAAEEQYQTHVVQANEALIAHLNKMNAWNDNMAKSYIKNAEDSYNSTFMTMVTIITISIILAVLLGYFIAKSIVNPLQMIVEISNEIAKGNLSRKVIVDRKDEIGQLEEAVKDMVANLRDIVTSVQGSADNVAASSEELTASADQSAQAANSVATAVMEVSQGADRQLQIAAESVSTAEKMSADSEQIAANANIVASTSEKAASSADEGRKSVETAINQMASIQKTVENLAQEITGLGVRSKEIGQIVDTISGIASQTNLLALNAAIEAARAGEQGRGFAVVAEEVRKLAEQSQEAAKQISSLIGGIQDDTGKAVQAMEAGTREVKVGSELVDSAGVAFREISELISQTTNQVREISEAINIMANDSQTIVAGAQEVNSLSRETSSQAQSVSAATEEQLASMQEIASASQALSKRAEELQEITKRFTM